MKYYGIRIDERDWVNSLTSRIVMGGPLMHVGRRVIY